MKKPVIDYRQLRFNNLNTPRFKHLWLLIFWPIFGLFFAFVEYDVIPRTYHVMHCALDDMIPFCELALIPYMFWFVYLIFPILYTLLYDIDNFEKMTRFTIITYGITMLVYFVYPTYQDLRPTAFVRSNILVELIRHFYNFDTNTNVNPSLHVVGAICAMAGFWHTKPFDSPGWRTLNVIVCVLISASTVFMKQHSVLDIPPAVLICLVAYPFVYRRDKAGQKMSFRI